MTNITDLQTLAKRVRKNIVTSTTAAGTGHPSSSLSAVELTVPLFFDGYFKQDTTHPEYISNDRFVLSKGHAAPLLFSLYEAAGVITEKELLTLRKFDSRLQGHPTPEFPYADVTTGSLGQGLSVAVGMAMGILKKFQILNSKFQIPRVYVLLGDSEFAEGQNYEALQLAGHYSLSNLIAVLDVNRLGQRGETQLGWDVKTYKKRLESFGWDVVVIENGNSLEEVSAVYRSHLTAQRSKPLMLIAKTKKGAGVQFMEDKDGWHGKPIPGNQLEEALRVIGDFDTTIVGTITKPSITNDKLQITNQSSNANDQTLHVTRYTLHDKVATREAYGQALADLTQKNKDVIALDAETSNSTYAEFVKKETPEQFIETYIAEQNMVSMGLGMSKVGWIPFVSSFAAFLTRAFDQIRMAQYSKPNMTVVGSHAGCSIGPDGASQMALEDIAMMRSVRESVVLYPSDAVSTYVLIHQVAGLTGLHYIRTTREKTPVLYGPDELFPVGGLKIHYASRVTHNVNREASGQRDNTLHATRYTTDAVIIGAGITLHEALKAQKILSEKKVNTVVVDLYSVKPLDGNTIAKLAQNTKKLIVVEDHHAAGGIGEAVLSELSTFDLRLSTQFIHLCVRKEPRSGTPEELMRYEEIDAEAIIKKVI